MSYRTLLLACLMLLSGVPAGAAPVQVSAEPESKSCKAALARAHDAVATLAPGSEARKFADFDLVQAKAEAGNGEFDDCMDYAASALDEVRHPHHLQTPDAAPRRQMK